MLYMLDRLLRHHIEAHMKEPYMLYKLDRLLGHPIEANMKGPYRGCISLYGFYSSKT